ncbi:anti-sigma-28 factor, FlgM family [Chthonomonas calidirosea]|uniref:flagellar biosynthesis anti-sigma factor FlgM n=1 Tax=Chthonomonas calidirosea TaxID=454171 RepID=UPI0006DD5390|nr:flagellar biosynthesis anti-sigma factor FlgM [Chthonomonas calidirosea]CEK18455.1 anti-sigma-28 factor, FlgM family [Chthonomonas calidirosea]CEK18456.1 anti-sigma-28 factor, FlgM family [Chthonomonas calidirosea]
MQISTEEVNRLLATTPIRGGSAKSRIARSQNSDSSSISSEAVSVEISAKAQDIQKVKQAIEQVPDVRMDRVMQLKALVESGQYHVSGEEVADLMIRRTLADNTAL